MAGIFMRGRIGGMDNFSVAVGSAISLALAYRAPAWLILLVYAPIVSLGVGLILLEAERQKIIPGNGMRFRKLRIAFSAVCLIAFVLVFVLWVQDYRGTRLIVSVRYAFPALISFGLALAPWASGPTRFSLRTLLIVTTLVAVLLGLLVWETRK